MTFKKATEVKHPWILSPLLFLSLKMHSLSGSGLLHVLHKAKSSSHSFLGPFQLPSCMDSFWWKTGKSLFYSSKFCIAVRPNSKSITILLKDFSGFICSHGILSFNKFSTVWRLIPPFQKRGIHAVAVTAVIDYSFSKDLVLPHQAGSR